MNKFNIYIKKNKYWLTLLGFVVWMIFFDQYDIKTIYSLHAQYRSMLKDKNYYVKEIEETNQKLKELTTNIDQLEKFARENYLMKRDDEDVFIIVEE